MLSDQGRTQAIDLRPSPIFGGRRPPPYRIRGESRSFTLFYYFPEISFHFSIFSSWFPYRERGGGVEIFSPCVLCSTLIQSGALSVVDPCTFNRIRIQGLIISKRLIG